MRTCKFCGKESEKAICKECDLLCKECAEPREEDSDRCKKCNKTRAFYAQIDWID